MTQRTITGPAGPIQITEAGRGPLVLLVHGFPETSTAWRHQLPALAAAGYHAIAVDLRGCGGSACPAEVSDYAILGLVDDLVAVVSGTSSDTAVVVGHDVGATVAATAALTLPHTFTATAMLGVPFTPPGGPRPSEVFAAIGGDEQFYVSYFQRPGLAEAEIEPDVRAWLSGFYTSLSGDAGPPAAATGLFFIPPGARMSDRFSAAPPPPWLTTRILDETTAAYRRTGLTGALNRYRNFDRDWAQLQPHHGQHLKVPNLFIGGEHDPSTTWLADAINHHDTAEILPGAGHWIHHERPGEVNRILRTWLGTGRR